MFTLQHSKDVFLPIPDNTNTGLQDVIQVMRNGKVSALKVTVDIKHGFSGDLRIALISPAGKSVIMHNRHGGPKPFKKSTFEGTSMAAFKGAPMKGNWTLQINDLAPRDSGMLNNWMLEVKAAHEEKPVGKVMVDIPDNSEEGLISLCEFKEDGTLEALKVSMNVSHAYIGDLTATLTAPSGKKATLHNREGGALKNINKTYKDAATAAFAGESIKGIWKLQINDHDKRDTGVLNGWGLSMKIGGDKDDLTRIEGIGPKIAALLNADGIYSFVDLSQASKKQLQACLDKGGNNFKTHEPTTWAQQASMAALGDWKNLKKWQDELDGGKVK